MSSTKSSPTEASRRPRQASCGRRIACRAANASAIPTPTYPSEPRSSLHRHRQDQPKVQSNSEQDQPPLFGPTLRSPAQHNDKMQRSRGTDTPVLSGRTLHLPGLVGTTSCADRTYLVNHRTSEGETPRPTALRRARGTEDAK
jgi:hypothetical protein